MFSLLGKIPRDKFYVACSGGIDSMVLVDFLKCFPKYKFSLLYFNHGTKHGSEAEEFLKNRSNELNLELIVGCIGREKEKRESKEEFWREERYNFLHSFSETVLTAHHLNDCVETWIHSSLCGNPKVIPYRRNNVIRPFLCVPKKEILSWQQRKEVIYIEDESNGDLRYTRNLIRQELMPTVLKINPGIEKVVRKKLISAVSDNG